MAIADRDLLADLAGSSQAKAEFRAITTPQGRHGIRLERAYWETLARIAQERGVPRAALIHDLKQSLDPDQNLTAMLRLYCLSWKSAQLAEFENTGGERLARAMVRAAPAPAIALSAEKRLLAWNEPFLAFVRAGFGLHAGIDEVNDLRLALDIPLDTVVQVLKENRNQPIKVGVAMGLAERRVRCTMNALVLPSAKTNVLVGYILQG